MLPTDSFSMANSRSLAGSTLTNPSCESVRLTLGGASEPAPDGPDGLVAAPCALALVPAPPRPDSDPSPECRSGYATTTARRVVATMAAATPVFLGWKAINRPRPARGRNRGDDGHCPAAGSTAINHS